MCCHVLPCAAVCHVPWLPCAKVSCPPGRAARQRPGFGRTGSSPCDATNCVRQSAGRNLRFFGGAWSLEAKSIEGQQQFEQSFTQAPHKSSTAERPKRTHEAVVNCGHPWLPLVTSLVTALVIHSASLHGRHPMPEEGQAYGSIRADQAVNRHARVIVPPQQVW